MVQSDPSLPMVRGTVGVQEDVWIDEGAEPRATLTLDGWARVDMLASVADNIQCLREVWSRRFDEHVLGRRDKRRPAQSQFDSYITILKAVLQAEEQRRRR